MFGIWFVPARLLWLLLLSLIVGPLLLLRGVFGPTAGPRLLRWYFERCGGGYVKVGQLLATRYDLLPLEYCEELGRLLDSLRPVPTARIVRQLERSLGVTLEKAFVTFEQAPIATASLAQVHGAVLHSGEAVVVKVLKPGIERRLAIDLWFLRLTGRILAVLPVLQRLDMQGIVDELSRVAAQEVDLDREALNTAHLHQLMAADAIAHYAPRVHRELSTRQVLTVERIRGVSVREIITALHEGDEEALGQWAARGIRPERTAVILLRSVLEQTMRFRTFNADPHPSNLIVSDGGRLNWVDFGLVGWLDERQWELQFRLREAVPRGRLHAAYTALLDSMEPLPGRWDVRGFEQDIKESLRDYLVASLDVSAPLAQRSFGAFLLRTLTTLRRRGLPMVTSTVLLYRTILVADMVMLRLYRNIDWVGHVRRFLDDVSSDLLTSAAEESLTSQYTAYRLARSPVAMADAVEWITQRLPELGRRTLDTLSVGERAVLAGLQLLRNGALWALAAVGVLGLATPRVSSATAVGRLVLAVERNPWPAAVVCIILFLFCVSFIRRIRPY